MDAATPTPCTIIALVERAVRDWVRALDLSDEGDAGNLTGEAACSVFYTDAARPDRIQTSGPDEDRCDIRIQPSDVAPDPGGGACLVVDVTLAHRRNGEPILTEFQVSLNEDLKVMVH